MSTTVRWGWVIQDQAAVIQGMSFGPGWLRGKSRTGPVGGGYHNLLVKDIVFHGNGKHALGAIVEQMNKMANVKVRCGIRKGMMVEKFEESEYGGGMDQVRVPATKEDVTHNAYYLYAFPDEGSSYSFNSLVGSVVTQSTGFIGMSEGPAKLARDVFESGVTAFEKASPFFKKNKSDLQKALASSKVFVVLTGSQRPGKQALATHRHTHSMPTLAKDIANGVLAGK